MKWFKHLVDSGDDPDIDDAINVFGPAGYYIFFRILEIMSREFDIKNPGMNTFSVLYLKRKLRCSWKRTLSVLRFYQEKKRIFFELSDDGRLDKIKLNCPKLKELTDEYTRKQIANLSGHTPDPCPKNIHIEAEAEAEADLKQTTGVPVADQSEPKTETPSKLFYLNQTPETPAILSLCDAITELDKKKSFNVFQWVQFWTNQNAHPGAILKTLKSLKKAWPVRTGKPWAYVDATIRTVNGNFNERESIERAAKFKEEIAVDARFSNLLKGIGE
jgi:hypothetical protein